MAFYNGLLFRNTTLGESIRKPVHFLVILTVVVIIIIIITVVVIVLVIITIISFCIFLLGKWGGEGVEFAINYILGIHKKMTSYASDIAMNKIVGSFPGWDASP